MNVSVNGRLVVYVPLCKDRNMNIHTIHCPLTLKVMELKVTLDHQCCSCGHLTLCNGDGHCVLMIIRCTIAHCNININQRKFISSFTVYYEGKGGRQHIVLAFINLLIKVWLSRSLYNSHRTFTKWITIWVQIENCFWIVQGFVKSTPGF